MNRSYYTGDRTKIDKRLCRRNHAMTSVRGLFFVCIAVFYEVIVLLAQLQKHRAAIKALTGTEKNIWFFILEGAVGAVVLNLTNPFFSMFAKRMGANDYQIGLISSLPALVGILALLPGAFLVDKQTDKKKIVSFFLLLTAVLYPLAAMSPFLGVSKVYVYILIIALLNWPFSVFNISWQSFFSDVFSPGKRSFAYAKRTKAATLAGAVAVLLGGLALSYLPRNDGQRIIIYQVFFFTAFLLALLQIRYLMQVSGYTVTEKASNTYTLRTVSASLKKLIANKAFMSFTIIAFLFHVSWQMAWPLFFLYQVDYLHANEAWLSIITLGNSLAGVATYSYWSKQIEKRGARFVVVLGALGLAVNPLVMVCVKSLPMALMLNTFIGLTFSGFQVALFECLMEVVPQENKTINIAIYTTFISISGFLSPMMGVAIYKLTSIYVAMVLAGILRLLMSGLLYLRYRAGTREQLTEGKTSMDI